MISSCGLSRFSVLFDGDGPRPLNRDTTVHILYGMLVLEYQECVVLMGRSLDFSSSVISSLAICILPIIISVSNYRGRLESQLVCDSDDDSDEEGAGNKDDKEEVFAPGFSLQLSPIFSPLEVYFC